MLALLSALLLLVELALGVAFLGFIVVGLGFLGEAYRNGLTPSHQAFVTLGVASAVLPVLVTLVVAWKRFLGASRAEYGFPAWMLLPLVVLVVCAGISFWAMRAGEHSAGRASQAKRDAELAAMRAAVEGGKTELACDLILIDPKATATDMARCRTRIESLSDPADRWRELAKFTDSWRGFHSWNAAQLGFIPAWDWNGTLVVIRHEQEWFLRTFYETWLARPGALASAEDLAQLHACISRSGVSAGWTPAVAKTFSATILPAIEARLTPAQRSDVEMVRAMESGTSTETRTGPLPATPADPVPAGAIGLARYDNGGTLHLWYRRTTTDGEIGDVYLGYTGSWDGPYEPMLKHLGKPSAGVVVPIPPID